MGQPAKNLPEIGILWALRSLVRLNGQKQFLAEDGFMDDELARTLGMEAYIPKDELESATFDRSLMLTKLRFKLRQMEASQNGITPPAPLQRNMSKLQEMAGLTETECRILEFAIMVHGMRDIESITEYPSSIRPSEVTKHLSIYLNLPINEIHMAVSRKSAMVRSGLFAVNGSDSFMPSMHEYLKLVSFTFAEQMLSENCDFDEIFREMVIPGKKTNLTLADFYHINDQLTILCQYLNNAIQTGKQGVNILIWGEPGVGKTALSRLIADVLGYQLFEIASESQAGYALNGDERFRAFSAAQSFFCRKDSLIVFDEVEDVFGSNRFMTNIFGGRGSLDAMPGMNKAWVNNILESNPIPTLWISNSFQGTIDPAHARRFSIIIELPISNQAQRWNTIKKMSNGMLNDETINQLSQSADLAPAVVSRAMDVIQTIEPNMAPEKASEWAKILVNGTLEAQSHKPLPKGSPSMLPSDYEPAFVNANYDLAEIAKGLAKSSQGRLLLMGPPGCGKTGYAHWLANQLGKPLHAKKGSDLLGPYVGESEKNIAKAFKDAHAAGAVLLIDEVDSFLGKRSNANHNWEVSLVNQVLVEMSDFGGYFVATTNLKADQLDEASLRRFDLKASFDYLRSEQVLLMAEHCCQKMGLPNLSANQRQTLLNLHKLTPGDFSVIASQAKFVSLQTTNKFIEALAHEHSVKSGGHTAIGFIG